MDPKVLVVFLIAVLLGSAAFRFRDVVTGREMEAFTAALMGDSIEVLCSQLDLDSDPDAKAACQGIAIGSNDGCLSKDSHLNGCKGIVVASDSEPVRHPDVVATESNCRGASCMTCMVARSMYYERDSILQGGTPKLLINYRRLARVFLVERHVCVPLKPPPGAPPGADPSVIDVSPGDVEILASSFPNKLRVGEEEKVMPGSWWASSDDWSSVQSLFQELSDKSGSRWSPSVIFPSRLSTNLEYEFLSSADPVTGEDNRIDAVDAVRFSSMLARAMAQVSVSGPVPNAFLYSNQPQYVPATFVYRFNGAGTALLPFYSSAQAPCSLDLKSDGSCELTEFEMQRPGNAIFQLGGTDVSVIVTVVVRMRTGDVTDTRVRGKAVGGKSGGWFCLRTNQPFVATERSVEDCEETSNLEGAYLGVVLDDIASP
jgi:hypothetical protein